MKISTILDQVDLGTIALPEFQRGFVWNRDQVRGLIASLYKRYPIGSLLVWVTQVDGVASRGNSNQSSGTIQLLLDGQQRITSLYGIIRGTPPAFFDGNRQAFTGLYFNLETEEFKFYSPLEMMNNPFWVNITALMQKGIGPVLQQFLTKPESQSKISDYINRMNALESIKDVDLHIEQVTGPDKTVDVVVEIFNRVNSGGTKLSKGDLALAKICAQWPDARQQMRARLAIWNQAGFNFKLEWLLRCINVILTGEALFTALEKVSTSEFQKGLQQAEKHINSLLNLISSRLGLDHDRVLGSRYSFPLMARYLALRNGHLADYRERDKLLYWYIHTFLWGRYAGSTETVLNQDLAAINNPDGALDRLISLLHHERSNLRLTAADFKGWSTGTRFYPLLYMLTRVWHARDWENGVELSNHMLGQLSRLELHHIFPKALLYQHGYNRTEVNAIANFTFLTKETNLRVSDRNPEEYLEEFAASHPGAVESHWIPMDRKLWRVENYLDFLAARRELLANAANAFLDSLLAGAMPQPLALASVLQHAPVAAGGVASEKEEQTLREINTWVVAQGLPEGEYMYELADVTGQVIAIVDLAWPAGLQEGFSEPVALLLDEDAQVQEAINRAGFRFFTSPEEFKRYVRENVLALPEAAN